MSATAISVTSQTERSPRQAPNSTRTRMPAARMNSGSTVGREKAEAIIEDGSSKSGGLGDGERLIEALDQRIDRSRARIDDRLGMHAVKDRQDDERRENSDLARRQIRDRHQIGLFDHAENDAPMEIERIGRRQDDAGGGEKRHPCVDRESSDRGQEFADEPGGAGQ